MRYYYYYYYCYYFFKKKKRPKLVQGLKALAAKAGEFNFSFSPRDPHDRGESTPKRCSLTSACVPINKHTCTQTHTHKYNLKKHTNKHLLNLRNRLSYNNRISLHFFQKELSCNSRVQALRTVLKFHWDPSD